MPEFVSQGIIDHDYTMLAMRRYAESSRHSWGNIIKKARRENAAIIEAISQFQKLELKSYYKSRQLFDAAQSRYDNLLARYLGYTKNKEPSSLREDAFQLAEARTAYIKASFEYCTTTSRTQAKLDVCLIKTLSEPSVLSPKEFAAADPVAQHIGIEMLRLSSWVKAMQKNHKPLSKEIEKVAKELEHEAIEKAAPSRDVNSYSVQNSTIPHFVPGPLEKEKSDASNGKHGWLFVKSSSNKGVRQIWVRRWVFIKSGMFGWLNVSPSRTFVQETDKIGVLLCHVTPIASEDRRFCFEIKTKDTVLFLQAETLEEMRSWLQAFEDAKHLAIESDKKSSISYAFQRFPPMISEFSSTAGTSVDFELTSQPTLPSDSQISPNIPSLGSSISLYKTPDASNLQALMIAGESLTNPSTKGVTGKVSFSSVGPFGTSLAPCPLINTPMPTSMSQEAILSNSIVSSSVIPTAITANYWGSFNWAVHQDQSAMIEDRMPPVIENVSRESSIIHLSLDRYPSYYPSELQAQDAQLHAIFQTSIGDALEDKTVLVFRCLFQVSAKKLIPARVYVTPNTVYIYSHCLGVTATKIIPMSSMVSIEGRSGLRQDTLFMITSEFTATCQIFLDSRRVLQKRIQFLIDNYHSDKPLDLEGIIEQLKSLSGDQKDDQWYDEEDESDSNQGKSDQVEMSTAEALFDMETRTDAEKRLLYLYMGNYMNGNGQNAISGPTKAISDLPPVENQIVTAAPDMSKLMSQLSAEQDFDIAPKTLFHIMFGETSSVFRYEDAGSMVRSGITASPWKLVNSQRMEREIYFKIEESRTPLEGHLDKLMYTQRLEKMDDNTGYIVYERRTIIKLPQGDNFYTAQRYVITRSSRGNSRLSIWSSVEWIKSSILKNVTEPFVLSKMKHEAKIVVNRTLHCRRLLGSRGGTTTAIRMFGKIGTSSISDSMKGNIYESSEAIGSVAPPEDTHYNSITVSRNTIGRSLLEAGASTFISLLGEFCMLLGNIVKGIWRGITSNKFIILGLLLSCAFNMFLISRSTSAYWMERHAQQFATELAVSPRSHSLMSRSILLQDVDFLIHNGSRFSVEVAIAQELGQNTSNSFCYNKFKSLALIPDNPVEAYAFDTPPGQQVNNRQHPMTSGFFNDMSSVKTAEAMQRRIFRARSKLGMQRNALMIELRSINRIESELVMAEWQSWLFEEVSICSRLTQEFATMDRLVRDSKEREGREEGLGEGEDTSTDGNGKKTTTSQSGFQDPIVKLILDSSIETRVALSKYCQSCSRELSSTLRSAPDVLKK